MIDRLFTAALAFCLLAGGTVAIGSAWFESPAPAAATVVVLPTVTIVGERAARTEVAQTQPSGAARVQ